MEPKLTLSLKAALASLIEAELSFPSSDALMQLMQTSCLFPPWPLSSEVTVVFEVGGAWAKQGVTVPLLLLMENNDQLVPLINSKDH
jgi:hypothetical protein